MRARAPVIVFEGIDGSGKTTVVRYIGRKLDREGGAVTTSEPYDRGVIREASRIARSLPDSPADAIRRSALLFAGDRVKHTVAMERFASSGKIVLCDRYYMSTIAYQGAQLALLGVDGYGWLRTINEPFVDFPSAVILLDSKPETAMKRISRRGRRHEIFETESLLGEARSLYAREFTRFRGLKLRVDADRSLDRVKEDVLSFIVDRLDVN
ncbi:MAG: dTMP kinase [Thermoplasmata archaeon]|uniref:Probable thymidylate kinase n=1 Tax=Candidatus Sysuiplasma superficiale TaxID=2823368 RepID=A0A8J7YKX4_9ARCH|nr:dTMP kinase [Candidatus Sysuiplasma superficiale]MBX8644383.1 dTMP kinase [Candidatus Sysuiplasma superficiale]MCL4346645.1 dTMP kinase [Candidatus Thermoplasmatota archaeon]